MKVAHVRVSKGQGASISLCIAACAIAGALVGLMRNQGTRGSLVGPGSHAHAVCAPCQPCQSCATSRTLDISIHEAVGSSGSSGSTSLPQLVKELQDASMIISNLRAQVAAQSNRILELQHSASQMAPSDRYVPWGPSPERDAAPTADHGLANLLQRMSQQLPAAPAHPTRLITNSASLGVDLTNIMLEKIATDGEVLVAVSNMALAGDGGMLQTFVEGVKSAGISNAMVVAIDQQTVQQVKKWGLHVHHMTIELQGAQKKLGMSNHGVSGMKFRILKKFTELGYAVLLSDVDIVFLQNPFLHLHRDCDVESMSDGWDNATAYGFNDVYDDPAMGWARFAHSMRQVVFNSGLFYLRPTQATVDFLDMIVNRLERESAWDQAVFNEEAAFPSSPVHPSPHIRRRTMDYMLFMNSKVLFRTVRKAPHLANHRPVSVHVNYHNDKHARMKAIIDRYVHGNTRALDNFPDGSHW